MPDSLEFPRMRRSVVPLMSCEGLAGFKRRVIDELVALGLGHAFRRGGRFTRRRSRLVPCFASVIRALNDLPKPAAGLRCIQSIRVSGRSLEVIELPAGKVRPAYVPSFAFRVRCQNERSLARTNQYSYLAHAL